MAFIYKIVALSLNHESDCLGVFSHLEFSDSATFYLGKFDGAPDIGQH